MVSIYVILSFEIIHRTSVVIFGALILLIASLLAGSIQPKETLHFVIDVIDFNTIGLLLGMVFLIYLRLYYLLNIYCWLQLPGC